MFDLAQTAEQTDLADALRLFGERVVRPLMTHGGRPAPDALEPAWRECTGWGLPRRSPRSTAARAPPTPAQRC